MARLRGASGAVRLTRTIRSFAVVGGAQFAPPPACAPSAARLQAERMACSWLSSTRKSWGGNVGHFWWGGWSLKVRVRHHRI